MPSKRLSMNKLNFDEIKTPFSFMKQSVFSRCANIVQTY